MTKHDRGRRFGAGMGGRLRQFLRIDRENRPRLASKLLQRRANESGYRGRVRAYLRLERKSN